MEFWGVELKGDKPVKVIPNADQVVHLSQATLAELKKSETITLYAKTGGQKLVIGLLSADNFPQLAFDLVFDKEVELSHNWKNGTVHLTGYKSILPDEDDDDDDFSMFSEDDAPVLEGLQNGVVAAPAASKPKPAAPVAKKDNKPKEDSDDDSEDDDSEDDDSDGDEPTADGLDSSSDDSGEDSSDEEEETPVKSAGNKKRPASASKTPEAKKAKIVTPQKTDGGKKSGVGHVATPHPAKNAKTPKSGGAQVTCGPCKKTFNSQGALDSHTKAKHSATK